MTLEDIKMAYDVSHLPEVQSGKVTPDEALRKFASQWDGGRKMGS